MKTHETASRLASLLYELMRSHCVPGVIEAIVKRDEEHDGFTLSNGYLAQYAEELAGRILAPHEEDLATVWEEWEEAIGAELRKNYKKDNHGHPADYREYLRSEHWKGVRAQKLREVGRRCQMCGEAELVINVHHQHYKSLGEEKMEDLTVLCEDCHGGYHIWRKAGKVKAKRRVHDYKRNTEKNGGKLVL